MNLAQLSPEQSARIERVEQTDNTSIQRLMILGLVEGAQLTFLGAALGGDPLEYRFYGSSISLRRAQAQSFQVSVLEGGAGGGI